MKKIALASLLFMSIGHTAETQTTRDLWYQAPVGVFGGETSPSYAHNETKISTTKVKSSIYRLEQTFNYTVVDNLSLSIGTSYASEDPDTGTTQSGIANPTLGVSYRTLVNSESSLYVRAKLEVTPSLLGKAKDNNQLSGNTKINFEPEIGQSLGAFEYSLSLPVTYTTETKNDSGDLKSTVDFGLVASGQYDFNEVVSGDFLLAFNFPGKATNKTSGLSAKTDYVLILGAGPNFQLVEKFSLQVLAVYTHATGDLSGIDLSSSVYGVSAIAKYNFN